MDKQKTKYHKHNMSQIMKKAILTFGLFSLVLVLTSFTTADTGGRGQAIDPGKKLDYETGGRGQSIDPGKKLDYETGGRGQAIDPGKKLDYETGGRGQSIDPGKKLD